MENAESVAAEPEPQPLAGEETKVNKIYVIERKGAHSKVWRILRLDVDPRDYPRNKPWDGEHGELYRLKKYIPEQTVEPEKP